MLPALARLPLSVRVEPSFTRRSPVEDTVSVAGLPPGVTDVVCPLSSSKYPSKVVKPTKPLFAPAVNVPTRFRAAPLGMSTSPPGWLVRFNVAPVPIVNVPAESDRLLMLIAEGLSVPSSVRLLPGAFRLTLKVVPPELFGAHGESVGLHENR